MDSKTEKTQRKKSIAVFSLASFLNDFGSDIIYPVWPIFVIALPGVNMAVLGLIDGLGEAIVSFSQAGSGYLSDRLKKRKFFIWTGYMFGAISRVGYAFSTVWQHLVPFKVLDRAGKMRSAPRDAIVADLSTNENRGRNFGLLRTMDNLGAVCGILTSIFLFGYLGWSYTSLFLLASFPSLISVLLILFFIEDRKAKEIYKGLSLKDLTFNFKLFLLLSAIFALGSFSYSFLMVYAEKAGFAKSFVPILYLIFTAIASLTALSFGKLADRLGRRFVLILAYLLWGLMCVGFIYTNDYLGIILLFVLYGLHRGAIEPVQKTFVSELSPMEHRASLLGAFQMTVGLCALPASLIAGLLWDTFGEHVPFYFSLGLTSLTVILMLFLREKTK
ncbi:MAG: MFS transporter [Candidatus Bathyarchaeota archaeon]|nr:MFS transporter [Candidatus Bathyarchaeota archaeon]